MPSSSHATKTNTQALHKLTKSAATTSLYNRRSILLAVGISVAYLFISYLLVGYKTDQLVLLFIFNSFYFSSYPSRRFIVAFSIFIVYWILFDWMKAFPNYQYNTVHIESLYQQEKSLFGFLHHEQVITPNEYFSAHHSLVADLLAGICYLCWVPVPLAFATYLYFKNRAYFFQFALSFFLVNMIGFIGYYMYPAAPPWYVAENGFQFIKDTKGNTAGLARFDAVVGIGIFKGIYAKSSNVFAAMPSLHAAYMLIVLFFGIRLRLKAWNYLFAFILTGIWFAAVYTSHHYILDILAGILSALLGIGLIRFFASSKKGTTIIDRLVHLTSAPATSAFNRKKSD